MLALLLQDSVQHHGRAFPFGSFFVLPMDDMLKKKRLIEQGRRLR